MRRLRMLLPAVCALAVWLPAPALAATDHPVDGSGTATFRTTIVDNATCVPDNPQQPSDLLCRERITGKFTETDGFIGDGHMGGRIIYDHGNVDENGCTATSGVFKFQTAIGFVRAKVAKGTRSCPDPDIPGNTLQQYTLLVTSGSNSYIDVSGGTITWNASVGPTPTAGWYSGPAAWSGIVTTEP